MNREGDFMKSKLLIGLALIAAPLSAASAMPVATFLARVEALKSKGAFAIFSGGEMLEAMNEVPPTERPRISTKDAISAYLAKRHPCPVG